MISVMCTAVSNTTLANGVLTQEFGVLSVRSVRSGTLESLQIVKAESLVCVTNNVCIEQHSLTESVLELKG